MSESVAGSYASLAGIEIINESRTFAYLQAGLGPGSINVYGNCGCPNLQDLLGCTEEEEFLTIDGLQLLNSPADPGVAQGWASTPDSAALSITSDIQLDAKIQPQDITPTTTMNIIAKWEGLPDDQRSYKMAISTTGNLEFSWTEDGTQGPGLPGAVTITSTIPLPFLDGDTFFVRATLDVDNGAAGHDVTFWYKTLLGATYTQLGTTVTNANNTSIFDSTADVELGSQDKGTNNKFTGVIYSASIRNGIEPAGFLAASPNFEPDDPAITPADISITDDQNNVWTRQGSAQFVDLPGVAGNYISTPDTPANSLQGTAQALRLTGHTGTYVSAPDTAPLSITGDIDIQVELAMDNWQATTSAIVAKWATNITRSYRLLINGGVPFIGHSADGSAQLGANATGAVSFTPGQRGWLRVTRIAATGVVNFYSSNDGVIWSAIGAPVAGTTGAIFNSTSIVEIGSQDTGSAANRLTGTVYEVRILDGIDGTIVANPDFTQTPWTIGDISPTARADSLGNVWTLNGNASIVAQAERRSLRLSGGDGVYASAPDSAALSIVGDIDIRVQLAMDDWTPSTLKTIVAKWGANNRSYRLHVSTTGALQLSWSPDGQVGTVITKTSSVVAGLSDGSIKWIRATLDVNNGAAGHSVDFYTSNDGVTWTPLGVTQTSAGITSIFDGTTSLQVGESFTTEDVVGNVFYAEVRNGINGTIVANPDFTSRPWDVGETGGATGADSVGNTWTLNGAGAVIQRAFASDLDVRIKLSMDDWTPGSFYNLIRKDSPQQSWRMQIGTTGNMHLEMSKDGSIWLPLGSSNMGLVDGTTKWIRFTWRASDGRVQFFTGDDGTNWLQLGADGIIAIPAIYDSTSQIQIGGSLTVVNVYYAEVRNGIDGVIVASFDPYNIYATSAMVPNTVPNTVGIWTINGAAWSWGRIGEFEPNPEVTFLAGEGFITVPATYTSPAADGAPWYSADIPESADFLGFIVDEFEGMGSTFKRTVTESVGNGGILNRSRLATRSMTWRGYLFGATCCSVQYGLRWLIKTLARFDNSCKDCFGDDLELLVCCPETTEDTATKENSFRLLKGVGLLEGVEILSERKTCQSGCAYGCGGSCILEVEFTLVASQPYFYSPPIPVYDCVVLSEGSEVVVPGPEDPCPPFNCGDPQFEVEGNCQEPQLPPTATYDSACFDQVLSGLDRANYLSVPRSAWNFLDEVVPVITISNFGPVTALGVKLGFYTSPDGNPCGDFLSNPPECDNLCDDLIIGLLPADSTFYIDGRTRKMSLICGDSNAAFPGERHTNGPWSWPVFSQFGFCMEVLFNNVTETNLCVSFSLVPRKF